MDAIRADHLKKAFGPVTAVDDVTLLISEGETCGFLGPNGAGETTTIRLLIGVLTPDAGSVQINGIDIHRHPLDAKMQMGVIPESSTVYGDLSAEQNLHLSGKMYGMPRALRHERIDEILSRLALSEKRHTLVRTFSKGMKQRVSIACAIAQYRQRVFAHFLAELRAGRTPNPDVARNREIKFGVCFEHARRLGAQWFATGHYARSAVVDGRPRLLRAADAGKDQTYFLHTVPGDLLARTLFPIGHLSKTEVRRIAHERVLPVHDKRDSTGICFIGERPFAEFLAHYLPAQPGEIETTDGRVLGRHRGLMYYTLGQRQGLALGGVRGAAEAPWYVADKDQPRNVLVVTQLHDDPRLLVPRVRDRVRTLDRGRATGHRVRVHRQDPLPAT